jgi:general secretion pathway protein J
MLADMRRRSRAFDPQGFTLVELLVGLTLVALISVILFGGMRFGIRAWEASGERAERTARVELVQTLLRRLLSQVRLPATAAATSIVGFAGQSDSATFIAPSPRQGETGEFVFVLRTNEAGQQSHLELRWMPLPRSSSAVAPNSSEATATLIENIASAELAYYGAPDPRQDAQWWKEWDGANGLPKLVRLRLTFPEDDPRRWPDLIVRPVLAAD